MPPLVSPTQRHETTKRILIDFFFSSTRYHEYDWVGKPGDYVTETPGTIHTLYMGEGSEVIFDVMGSIEFYNEDNTLREIMDGFSFWRMYEDHCEEKGVEPNKGLWY